MDFFCRLHSLMGLVVQFAMGLEWQWWILSLCIALFSVVLCIYRNQNSLRKSRKSWEIVSVGLLWFYLFLVFSFTVLSRMPVHRTGPPVNLDLLGNLILRMSLPSRRYEILLNMAMFMPVGFLLAAAMCWKCGRTIAFSALFSLAIEMSQLVLMRGTCELSDLFVNTIGAFMGYGVYLLLRTWIR